MTISIMEAELREAAQTSILLERFGLLLDELAGSCAGRWLRVENFS